MVKRGIVSSVLEWHARVWPLRFLLPVAIVLGAAATPAAAGQTRARGIDVSHWQGAPDWVAVKADGVAFAFVKATEGQSMVDEQYAANRSNAAAAGVPMGAYHFARPGPGTDDAVNEADYFVDTAALTGRDLLPVLDLEDDGGLSAKQLRRWTKAWLARVRERLGVKPIIYTFPFFWQDEMGNSRWFADNGYRLWIAHWGKDQPRVPANGWGGRGWTIWQYDNCGSVEGIDGCVDRDVLAVTVGSLRIRNNR